MEEKKPTYEELAKALEEEIKTREALEVEVENYRKLFDYMNSLKTEKEFLAFRKTVLKAKDIVKWKQQ